MKSLSVLIVAVVGVAVLPAAAQMMPPPDVGGSRRTMISLVSPANSLTQIRRGAVMIGQHMVNLEVMATPSAQTHGQGTTGLQLTLHLTGVSNDSSLVTSGGNHLVFEGRLTVVGAVEQPVAVDETFSLHAGSALVQVPVTLPALTHPATVAIDRLAVLDSSGNTFAVPGVVIVPPTPHATPHPTPTNEQCIRDSDCDDHDAHTRDLCTPMGCRHMHGHM